MPTKDDKSKRLSKEEARALARAMLKLSGGTTNFRSLIQKAKADCGGNLTGETLWQQIEREMAGMDAERLSIRTRTGIATSVVLVIIVAVACIMGSRSRLRA